jgi:regulator of replication initiation timing
MTSKELVTIYKQIKTLMNRVKELEIENKKLRLEIAKAKQDNSYTTRGNWVELEDNIQTHDSYEEKNVK